MPHEHRVALCCLKIFCISSPPCRGTPSFFTFCATNACAMTGCSWLIRDTALAELSLEELIRSTAGNPAQHTVFRWAAEVWNHKLHWRSMRSRGGGSAHGPVAEQIARRFGSFERFTQEFRETASRAFRQRLDLVWCGVTRRCRSSRPLTPAHPWCAAMWRCWRWICGSTPTILISKTAGRRARCVPRGFGRLGTAPTKF